ncbi:DUF2309 domain-containing protein [Bermanella marisrubri]|uniref:Probable inorganic carbon transporter subunit DabA n=1 Tax=Bermanella marisrubri TaxID=207949 RepID=Q1N3C7_9GAMM|nr:DUF2309 domain-containing protein [Bermanella marisrubri]EAT12664.1 hypothetical protein RED65_13307 [Oceanobacter sp. RED65] [Bermanella marisrubri]QIZ85212.1 DUF2309 domain-containing protein [Bermanella marisrubri]
MIPVKQDVEMALAENIENLLHKACEKIAPTWPLDEFIAVNPFWKMRNESIDQVSSKLSALAQVQCLMPASYYLQQWQQGKIKEKHLQRAASLMGSKETNKNLLAVVKQQSDLPHWHHISDLLDSGRDRQHKMAWRDEITHQISQFCAAYFQKDGPVNPTRLGESKNLYEQWLWVVQKDKGIAILMDEARLNDYFKQLPDNEESLIARALMDLQVSEIAIEDYAHALLLDINGWASWIAYLNWQKDLGQSENNVPSMMSLLAIRMAWEWVLWQYHNDEYPHLGRKLSHMWQKEQASLPQLIRQHEDLQKTLWVWQRAMELAYQEQIAEQLLANNESKDLQSAKIERPKLQAAFCIDVRSEVIRRALESQNSDIQTLGFAGFFGLPIEYSPLGSQRSRKQLPGLLAPSIRAELDSFARHEQEQKASRGYNSQARYQEWSQSSAASFSMVEAGGWMYAFKLLKQSFWPSKKSDSMVPDNHSWVLKTGHRSLTREEKSNLAATILKAMGLTHNIAPSVLLVGHGVQCSNNPHAAGLECGACGGQSGEVNVRVLAQLLNDSRVREDMAQFDINIPLETQFIAALHNTTTDEIRILSEGHTLRLEMQEWLQNAQVLAQQERAVRLKLDASDERLSQYIEQRTKDWSQVRPEWGLANNAAFIIAPRDMSQSVDLQGRAFLHDYDWQKDQDGSLLRTIMTAPMVVTNWINMQYNASVWDNHKYGSGNKVLHNVVGGNIGVFEGNGGDLRIGLPMQSIHDGENWQHQAMRLSVFIRAPRERIEQIIETESVVSDLVKNGWLHLLQISDDGKNVAQFALNQWHEMGVDTIEH